MQKEHFHKMNNTNEIYKKLQEKAELVAGRKMESPRDFDYLSMRILDKTKNYIAPITLKRFWGYLGKKYCAKPYLNTLNTIALYAGYENFNGFSKSLDDNTTQSDFLPNKCVQISSLRVGDKIQLTWYPDRSVTIQYQGYEMFKTTEVINSKLNVGDTFFIGQIIDGEPLHLRCLVHKGGLPTNYVCGRVNGVKFKLL